MEPRTLFNSISGTTFEDRNNNALLDATPDLAVGSTTVFLDANDNHQRDTGETAVVSSTAAATLGQYTFNNVGAGTFRVRVVVPSSAFGYVQTTQSATSGTQTVTLANASTSATGVNFGWRNPTQSSNITGFAFSDEDGDGSRDADEPGLSNVTVYVDLNQNGSFDVAAEPIGTSASTGQWVVSALNPNYTTTYHVRAITPNDAMQTRPASNGDFVITSTANGGNYPVDVFGFVDLSHPRGVDRFAYIPNFVDPFETGVFAKVVFQEPITYSAQANLAPIITPTVGGAAVAAGSVKTQIVSAKSLLLSIPATKLTSGAYRVTLPIGAIADSAARTNNVAITIDLIVVNGGTTLVVPAGMGILRTQAIAMESSAKLDLKDNDLLIDYGLTVFATSPAALVKSGRANGAWTGNGITSSTARTNPLENTTLGVLSGGKYRSLAGDTATFDGQAVDVTSFLVKYTYYGDVDFNGAVDSTDYNLIDFGFLTNANDWSNGDVDGSGAIDGTDYNLIDFAFVSQAAAL